MLSASFGFGDRALRVIKELSERDSLSPAEVVRRALSLYHFVKSEMHEAGMSSDIPVELKIGGKHISVKVP